MMQSPEAAQQRQEVRTFWTGPPLSYYEQLSLKSMVAAGARVILYTYDGNLAVPDGVEVADASEILSGPVHQFRHANGDQSLALHSDLFRYLAIHRYGGWYMDLDVVVLGHALPSSRFYLAHEQTGSVNAAVMKFPAGAPIMGAAIDEALRLLPEAGKATTDLARISIGPALITSLVPEYALDHLIQPASSAYEIPHSDVLAFFDPARCESVRRRLDRSDFTHLWNEVWRLCRIPKHYGPPEGSFLDTLFRRFEIDIPAHGRLAYEAVEAWVKEYRVLEELKSKLSIGKVRFDTLDHLARSIQINGWRFGVRRITDDDAGKPVPPRHALAAEPQTVRTFWHGDVMGLYQLMCLRSFTDRGHRVEVFSYNPDLSVPEWIKVRNAADVAPRERIVRSLQDGGREAIHANLFRYILLHQLGGWWIDPDVLLLATDLPPEDLFFARQDAFGLVPMGALKFPAHHPLLAEAVRQAELLGERVEDWDRSGALLFTALLKLHEMGAGIEARPRLGPVAWHDVTDLFNPSKADELYQKSTGHSFLHLHDDVWRRAGIPHGLAPPEGSLLNSLLAQHDNGFRFAMRMTFDQLNRWLTHMYQYVRQQRVLL